MARIIDNDSTPIFAAATEWRDRCLIGGKSLLWPDREIWSVTNLHKFKTCFVDRPYTSKDKNFEKKFEAQLATESEDVTRLASELLYVYFLFPSSVGQARKVGLIREVASWKGVEIDEKADREIGKPGRGSASTANSSSICATMGVAIESRGFSCTASKNCLLPSLFGAGLHRSTDLSTGSLEDICAASCELQ